MKKPAESHICGTLQASLRKKDSDMKIDKTTYKDRKERIIGMIADYTNRPDKVLFFADPHFLFFLRADTHCTHWQVARADTQSKTCQRVQSTILKI
jgi:hypothetical protein